MVKKNDVDDRLIAAMKDEHRKMRDKLSKLEMNAQQDQQELLHEQRGFFDKANQQLEQRLSLKEEEVIQQQLQIRELRDQLAEKADNLLAATRPPSRPSAESNQVNVLKVENKRLGELLDVFKEKLEEERDQKAELAKKHRASKRRTVELEKKLGNAKIKRRDKSRPAGDSAAELEALQEEHEETKRIFRRQLSEARAEMQQYRNMAAEMRKQINSAHGSRAGASREDEELSAEYELLQERHAELQKRYSDLVARVQGNRGSPKKLPPAGGRMRPRT